jgi:hypothetical protein
MSSINRIVLTAKHLGVAGLIVAGVLLASCSSAPEPQPEPSKKEVQQDADRFFEKMKKEEPQNPSPK